MKELDQTQKKVILFWILLGMIVLILFFFLRFFKIDFNRKSSSFDKNYHLVTDYSRYYTVSSTVDKFYQFLNAGNKESVLHILDEQYKEEQNLTEETVLTELKKEKVSISFQSGMMCEKRVRENITYFLVKGSVVGLNEQKSYQEAFYQVVLDESSFHFSIRPIEEKTFGDECHE